MARIWTVLLFASLLAFPKDSFPVTAQERRAQAVDLFERAMRLRTTLEAQPENQRRKADYEKIIRMLQRAYYVCPDYTKVPVGLAVVAELYEEMGRVYSEDRYYLESIKAYKFVASQYPMSRVVRDALYTIGEIYRTDLENPEEDSKAFETYLDKFPKTD